MAKHAKKNNIISYDEAKQKKLQKKEDESRSNARHIRDEFNDEYNDIYGNTYSNTENKKYDTPVHNNENDDRYEDQNLRFRKRDNKYYDDVANESAPRTLINVIVIGLMSLLLTFICIMMYNYYVVETITVIGNDEVKYHDVTQLCGVKYKQSMLKVKKEDIIESFERQKPMIQVIDVKKIWPNILEITVKERPPVCFIVLKGSQKCALIGENNLCLSIVDSYLEGNIPRIYGLDVGSGELGREIVDGETRQLLALKELISAMIETDCIAELESININNTTNITMQSTTGTSIKIGDTSNLVNKFAKIKIMIIHLINTNNTDVGMVVTGDNSIDIEEN